LNLSEFVSLIVPNHLSTFLDYSWLHILNVNVLLSNDWLFNNLLLRSASNESFLFLNVSTEILGSFLSAEHTSSKVLNVLDEASLLLHTSSSEL